MKAAWIKRMWWVGGCSGVTLEYWGFPGGSDVKESACNAGDPGSVPESGQFPREGNGYPLQYSCLSRKERMKSWHLWQHGWS